MLSKSTRESKHSLGSPLTSEASSNVVNVKLFCPKFELSLFLCVTSLISSAAVAPSYANGTYDPDSGSGTVACSRGGEFTVELGIVIGSQNCAGHAQVPEFTEYIDFRAFYGETLLTSISIPASVTSLGQESFYESGLKSVSFASGSNLTYISQSAFNQAGSLTKIVIPANVISIDDYAFMNTDALKSVVFATGSRLETIGRKAFYDTDLTSITIPSSVTTIAEGAFEGSSLKSVTFADKSKLTFLESRVFMDAESLSSVNFGESGSLSQIRDWAFYNTAIKEISIPKSVSYVGSLAFQESYLLSRIYYLGNAPRDDGEFGGLCLWPCGLKTAFVTNGAKGFGRIGGMNRGFVVAKMPATAFVKPTISGTPKVSKTLQLSKGKWVGYTNPAISYQWYSCTKQVKAVTQTIPKTCKKISKATKSKLTVTKAFKENYLAVLVTGKSTGTTAAKWLSKSTAKVK